MEIREAIEKILAEGLVSAVLSNPVRLANPAHKEDTSYKDKTSGKEDTVYKEDQAFQKVTLRPVMIGGRKMIQAARYTTQQVFHENIEEGRGTETLEKEILLYKQTQVQTLSASWTILVSKKGKTTIKRKVTGQHHAGQNDLAVGQDNGYCHNRAGGQRPICRNKQEDGQMGAFGSHNRQKNYILKEGVPVPFLVDLGVMTADGRVVKAYYDKYRQINRFLEFIEDVLPALPRDRQITMIDFGCGKSYLTFAMYYYFNELKGMDVAITGLDLKEKVIRDCSRLAEKYGYERLHFLCGDIADFEGADHVDMVVTLHACDTATDHALYKAVRWGAKVILSVPCCQHELNRQIKCDVLSGPFSYGLVKERAAALFTDAMRGQLLEMQGYKVQLMEFIDMAHTPKNILIRAVKTGRLMPASAKNHVQVKYENCRDFLGASPTLEHLLNELKEENTDA